MNYRELSTLLVKIAGAIIIIYELVGIPNYVSYYFSLRLEEDSILTFFLISILPLSIPLFAGFILFFFPSTIVNKLLISSEEDNSNGELVNILQVIAFSVLGLYLVFNVLSDFIYNFTYLYQINGLLDEENPLVMDTFARIFATIAELFFALYLLFGSRSLVALLGKARRLGT